jgi:cell wall-associated NlpC family hydrolase
MERVKKILFILFLSLTVACTSGAQRAGAEFNDPFAYDQTYFDAFIKELAYSEDQKNLITFGRDLLGSRYVYGAEDPDVGFDCSGFTQYVYENSLQMELPRTSREMKLVGLPVYNKDQLEAGDLVFFNMSGRNSSHVGIYIGEGKFFHASPSRGQIIIGNMNDDYFSKRFSGARRILSAGFQG